MRNSSHATAFWPGPMKKLSGRNAAIKDTSPKALGLEFSCSRFGGDGDSWNALACRFILTGWLSLDYSSTSLEVGRSSLSSWLSFTQGWLIVDAWLEVLFCNKFCGFLRRRLNPLLSLEPRGCLSSSSFSQKSSRSFRTQWLWSFSNQSLRFCPKSYALQILSILPSQYASVWFRLTTSLLLLSRNIYSKLKVTNS